MLLAISLASFSLTHINLAFAQTERTEALAQCFQEESSNYGLQIISNLFRVVLISEASIIMVYTSKEKNLELERQKQKQVEKNIRNHIPQGFDFMPGFKKEIECWKSAIVTDLNTGVKTYWPIDPVTAKRRREYEAFLSKIFNSETLKFYPQIKDDYQDKCEISIG